MNGTQLELKTVVTALQDAWNAADSERYAQLFDEDADFIHILGGHGAGRTSIAQAHAKLFETIYHGSRVSYAIEGTRFVDDDTAILRLFQGLEFGPPSARHNIYCRPSVLLRRYESAWRILFMQNTRVAESKTVVSELERHPFAPVEEAVS